VKSPAAGAGGLSEMQLKVYNTLSDEPKHVDDISLTANIELRRVLAVLTTLEIEGFALSYPGRRYSVMK
jgi:DNA processing protein